MDEKEVVRKMFISNRRERIKHLLIERNDYGALKQQFKSMTWDEMIDYVIGECDKHE